MQSIKAPSNPSPANAPASKSPASKFSALPVMESLGDRVMLSVSVILPVPVGVPDVVGIFPNAGLVGDQFKGVDAKFLPFLAQQAIGGAISKDELTGLALKVFSDQDQKDFGGGFIKIFDPASDSAAAFGDGSVDGFGDGSVAKVFGGDLLKLLAGEDYKIVLANADDPFTVSELKIDASAVLQKYGPIFSPPAGTVSAASVAAAGAAQVNLPAVQDAYKLFLGDSLKILGTDAFNLFTNTDTDPANVLTGEQYKELSQKIIPILATETVQGLVDNSALIGLLAKIMPPGSTASPGSFDLKIFGGDVLKILGGEDAKLVTIDWGDLVGGAELKLDASLVIQQFGASLGLPAVQDAYKLFTGDELKIFGQDVVNLLVAPPIGTSTASATPDGSAIAGASINTNIDAGFLGGLTIVSDPLNNLPQDVIN